MILTGTFLANERKSLLGHHGRELMVLLLYDIPNAPVATTADITILVLLIRSLFSKEDLFLDASKNLQY
ncbi:MAG: hypothetical protein M3Y53_04230 [Thermoproteota archaeon]|nr:hypothetical protein [Thermoproteota archaeon]